MRKLLIGFLLVITTLITGGCMRSQLITDSDYVVNEEIYSNFATPLYTDYFYHARISKSTADTVSMTLIYKRSYIYMGFINNVLKIKEQGYSPSQVYNEFIKDESELFEYQLTPPDTLNIRSLKMVVHSADNQGIKFTIINRPLVYAQ